MIIKKTEKKNLTVSYVCIHRFIVTAAFVRVMYLRNKCISTSLMISAKSYLLYTNDKNITCDKAREEYIRFKYHFDFDKSIIKWLLNFPKISLWFFSRYIYIIIYTNYLRTQTK